MDIHLPGMSGVDAVRKLKTLLPQTQFIMSKVYKDNDAISRVDGRSQRLSVKANSAKELLAALREVCAERR